MALYERSFEIDALEAQVDQIYEEQIEMHEDAAVREENMILK